MYYFSFVYFYDNDLYIGVHNRRVPHFFIDFMDFALTVLAEHMLCGCQKSEVLFCSVDPFTIRSINVYVNHARRYAWSM